MAWLISLTNQIINYIYENQENLCETILHTPWGRTHSVKLYNMLGIKSNGGYFYTLIA